MKKTYTFILLSMLLLLGCSRKVVVEPTGNIVRIGVIAPLSGEDEAMGKSGLQGVETALKINDLLDNGDRIELIVEDDQSRSDQTVIAFKRLQQEDVKAILLLSASNSALALGAVGSASPVPIVATVATHPDITKKNRFMNQLCFDDAFQGTVAAHYLRDELFLEKAVIISDKGDDHSSFLANEFIRQFEGADGGVAGHISLSETPASLAERMKIFKKQEVDTLYAPVSAEHLLYLADNMRDSGWEPTVMTSDGVLGTMELEHPGKMELLEGVLATDVYSASAVLTDQGKKLREVYQGVANKKGSTFAILGAEGLLLLFEAFQRSEAPYEANGLQTGMRYIKGFQGVSELFSMGKDGKVIRPVYVNGLVDGEMTSRVKVY